jgi:arylsulfatase A-like enzyme
MIGEKMLSRPAFTMNFEENPSRGHQITRGSLAVWEGDYKMIHYLEKDVSLLFNLRQDPDELENLYYIKEDVANRLLNIIRDNLEEANERIVWKD